MLAAITDCSKSIHDVRLIFCVCLFAQTLWYMTLRYKEPQAGDPRNSVTTTNSSSDHTHLARIWHAPPAALGGQLRPASGNYLEWISIVEPSPGARRHYRLLSVVKLIFCVCLFEQMYTSVQGTTNRRAVAVPPAAAPGGGIRPA